MATKAEKNHEAEKKKIKKSMEKGDTESARIYASNAIRLKNEGLNYLRMQSKMDAVASKIQSQMQMKSVTKNMADVTKGMSKVLESMDMSKIEAVMSKFEEVVEGVDVKTGYIENAMNSATASVTPEDDVEKLMQQVADEHGLEVANNLSAAGTAPVAAAAGAGQSNQEDTLEKRLAALRAS